MQTPPSHPFELSHCLAKTYSDGERANIHGRDVFSHCLIVGHVARTLLARMPYWLKEELYPNHSELIAASHDVGKICPTFQEKIRRGRNNCADYEHNSHPGLEGIDPILEKQWAGHAGLSQITLAHCKVGKFIPEIVGQHHGRSPTKTQVSGPANAEVYGGPGWENLREQLLEELKAALQANWPSIKNDKQARLLAGLTTVADWIGSASRFDDPKNEQWKIDIEAAVNGAGFFPLEVKKGLPFEQVFLGCTPRPIQQHLIDVCNAPGVYILEAPMGIGKTEAALYAAYKILESNQASGIYFALPTQLTSDKIHERINRFLDQIIPINAPNRKAMLAHANAKLKIMDFGEEGAPGGSWFSERKRELLAPFGVGTIDQALMSVLNIKHGFVRAFGLAGKVVILDEIHSYDVYTGTMIDSLIKHLVAWKCTVIILSATLTKFRRQQLLNLASQEVKDHYPLISVKTQENFFEVLVTPDPDAAVKIHLCHNTSTAIDEALDRASEGQQVLWVENTVQEAQEIYRIINARASECNITCGLLHARFTRAHRADIEAEWIELFGKTGGTQRVKEGRILIGTQILEQSLDIDADFLVTRLCPTDMLLQRLGRLWRHKDTIRLPQAKQEAWILSPDIKQALDNPEIALGKSCSVYSPYYLLRTLELFTPLSDTFLLLPSHIRQLIESTYQDRRDNGRMKDLKKDLENKKEKLERLAKEGLSQGGKTESDDCVPTRYSEQITCEVLIIQNWEDVKGDISLINNETLHLPTHPDLKKRKEISLKLHQHIVKVDEKKAPPPKPADSLNWIKDYLYIDREKPLRIVKLAPTDELLSLENSSFSNKPHYTPKLGYYFKEQHHDH